MRRQSGDRIAPIASPRWMAKWRVISAMSGPCPRMSASAMSLQVALLIGACPFRPPVRRPRRSSRPAPGGRVLDRPVPAVPPEQPLWSAPVLRNRGDPVCLHRFPIPVGVRLPPLALDLEDLRDMGMVDHARQGRHGPDAPPLDAAMRPDPFLLEDPAPSRWCRASRMSPVCSASPSSDGRPVGLDDAAGGIPCCV